MPTLEITAANVREFLDYNPETGQFVWRPRVETAALQNSQVGNWNARFAWKPVAQRRHRHGHHQIGMFGRNYMAHRLAWMHYYGTDPDRGIDHISGDPQDNRILNLRLATASQNMMNAKIRVNNTSGVKGVSWRQKEGKWYAYINKNKKMYAIGKFESFGDAVLARKRAEATLHGAFARAS